MTQYHLSELESDGMADEQIDEQLPRREDVYVVKGKGIAELNPLILLHSPAFRERLRKFQGRVDAAIDAAQEQEKGDE